MDELFTEKEKEIMAEAIKYKELKNKIYSYLSQVHWSNLFGMPQVELLDDAVRCLGSDEITIPATKKRLVVILEWNL